MRRARPGFRVPASLGIAALSLCLAACESKPRGSSELTFERSTDTTGLSRGQAIVREFEPYRMDNGALRVRGAVNLPDGTRLQVSVRRPDAEVTVQMVQVTVEGGRFDSPPMIGDRGPLPEGPYRFEILTHFTPEWQSAQVLRATDDGRALRGPGVTRTKQGVASLHLIEEATL